MQITCYSGFSKKPNSTKQPSGSGTAKTVTLKEPTSVLNPVFILTGYDLSYNYIQWGSRYYFVDDIVIVHNNTAEYHCSTDVLGTYKTDIGNSSQYVTRSASSYDLTVADTYYPSLAKNTHEASVETSPFTKGSGSRWVIGVQGKQAAGNGGSVTYYSATGAAIQGMINGFLNDPSYYGQSEISNELLSCIFNPMQYMVSCMWFPFAPAIGNGDVGFGWWTFNTDHIKPLTGLTTASNLQFTIPKHPKSSRGNYMNLPPFANYRLEAGPWGVIPLDAFNLLDATQLDCRWEVDMMTGSGRFDIKYRDKLCYDASYTAQIGVPVQLGQNMMNQGALMETVGGGVGAISSALTLNPGGLMTNGLSAIMSAAQLSQPVPSSIGSNGTMSFNNVFALMADFKDIADEDLATIGRPLCKVKTISTLSGYILCEKADLDTAATPTEKEQIISAMNTGFYYE